MKKVTIVLAMAALTTTILVFSCKNPSADSGTVTLSQDSLVKKGAYLVSVMGCDDCHSNKVMGAQGPELDMANRFGGHLASAQLGPIDKSQLDKGWVLFSMAQTATFGPWGISYAANISSSEHGIGNWTLDQFKLALREGKYKGLKESRPLLPPMPWEGYKNLKDEDIEAIFTYLKSTPPVDNVVPAWVPIAEVK